MTQQLAFYVYTVSTVYTVCVYNAWAHSQSKVVATLHSVGKINKDQQKY